MIFMIINKILKFTQTIEAICLQKSCLTLSFFLNNTVTNSLLVLMDTLGVWWYYPNKTVAQFVP